MNFPQRAMKSAIEGQRGQAHDVEVIPSKNYLTFTSKLNKILASISVFYHTDNRLYYQLKTTNKLSYQVSAPNGYITYYPYYINVKMKSNDFQKCVYDRFKLKIWLGSVPLPTIRTCMNWYQQHSSQLIYEHEWKVIIEHRIESLPMSPNHFQNSYTFPSVDSPFSRRSINESQRRSFHQSHHRFMHQSTMPVSHIPSENTTNHKDLSDNSSFELQRLKIQLSNAERLNAKQKARVRFSRYLLVFIIIISIIMGFIAKTVYRNYEIRSYWQSSWLFLNRWGQELNKTGDQEPAESV